MVGTGLAFRVVLLPLVDLSEPQRGVSPTWSMESCRPGDRLELAAGAGGRQVLPHEEAGSTPGRWEMRLIILGSQEAAGDVRT